MDSSIIDRLQKRVAQQLHGDGSASEGWPEASPEASGEIGELVATLRDVALAHEKQAQSQRVIVGQLRAILDSASVGIAITRSGLIELLGQHCCRMFGYSEEELLGCSTRLIQLSDAVYAEFGARVGAALSAQGHFDGEQILRRKDGGEFWAHMLARAVTPGDPDGGTIWIVEDISGAKAARDQLSWTATHDSLTQLVNRREFESRLTQAMNQFDGHKLCILYIDLDRFKVINDSAGHATGDEVLCQISRLLEAQVRQSDLVGRLGGDEFAVLLPGCSLARAQQLAEQIRAAVDSWRLPHEGGEFSVGASIGVAAVTPELTDMASVIHAADSACYEAKNGGRNRVVTYAPRQSSP
ncbi:sensor domain-containing diguanylate cyclase [Rhodoferax sp. UBA5149]|uniref:sensor domain-containing diguanylate cyclase n=1 Tax=Rhodoferax sp. UBA5149 TaxID=1947379 RepID=UPI0025F9B36E|nr:sensor domain-containing diguanylate cyclase [Rhodoferax sp. UBA5149]